MRRIFLRAPCRSPLPPSRPVRRPSRPTFAGATPDAARAGFRAGPVYNWSGFYLGINGGWGFGTSNWTNSCSAIRVIST